MSRRGGRGRLGPRGPRLSPARLRDQPAGREAQREQQDQPHQEQPQEGRAAQEPGPWTALTDAQSTLFTLRGSGIAIPGEPVLDPVVTEVVLGDAPTAALTDCVDSTNWQPIYVATKESASAPDQAMRVVAEATAFVAEGQWRIRTFTIYRDRTC